MRNLVVHSPKPNFWLQLSLKIHATFCKNKCKFFRILELQKLALVIMSAQVQCCTQSQVRREKKIIFPRKSKWRAKKDHHARKKKKIKKSKNEEAWKIDKKMRVDSLQIPFTYTNWNKDKYVYCIMQSIWSSLKNNWLDYEIIPFDSSKKKANMFEFLKHFHFLLSTSFSFVLASCKNQNVGFPTI